MDVDFENNKLNYVTKSTNLKTAKNEDIIKYTFYELRVVYDLSNEQMEDFIITKII